VPASGGTAPARRQHRPPSGAKGTRRFAAGGRSYTRKPVHLWERLCEAWRERS
jgi:hypothetical protein